MKKIFLLSIKVFFVIFLISNNNLNAQKNSGNIGEMQNWIDKNIVHLSVGGEKGVGFICGKFDSGVYVVTTRHTIGKYENLNNNKISQKDIIVEIKDRGRYTNNSCVYWASRHRFYDFAIIKVRGNNIPWKQDCVDPSPGDGEDVRLRIFDYGRQTVSGNISSLNQVSREKCGNTKLHYVYSGSSLSNGASGTAIYTKDGIIGILLETDQGSKAALPIQSIRDILKQDSYGSFFQLNNARKIRDKIKKGTRFLIKFDMVLGGFRCCSGYAAHYDGASLVLTGSPKGSKKSQTKKGTCNIDKYELRLWGGLYYFNEKKHVLDRNGKKVGVMTRL